MPLANEGRQLTRQLTHGLFEMAADQGLCTAAIRANHVHHKFLAQYGFRQVFLFGNHLQQDATSDVGVIFLVDDYLINSVDHQASYIRQRYIPALDRVVEAAVRIFLNHSRIAHGAPRSCLTGALPKDAGTCPMPTVNIPSLNETKDSATQREGKSGFSLHDLGETGGSETVSLLQSEIPGHNHTMRANNSDGLSPSPVNNVSSGPGADRDLFWYKDGVPNTTMNPNASGISGGDQPHNNLMPYLTLNYCIALQGVYPPRT